MQPTVNEYYDKSEGDLELGWEDVEAAAYSIIQSMKDDGFEPDIIISIARSGLIPAALISYAMGNKELYVIKVDFSKNQKISHRQDMREKPKISQGLDKDVEGLKVLVVDEVVISGETLKMVSNYLGMKHPAEAKYAVLYRQPWSQFTPDYCGKEVTAWPIFPWKRLKNGNA
ncbi:MAG: phosphoribosyltransferase [Candidatus Magasanikbacteria bacterium CG10_big_fil_rev_8_21_14_0_10_43_6]|uniref:Phosphoribosyltransferase n=1 Tax=Candidatus Magasanikbacteria bacterium CG10_big_fil_rev_8_21_14_0_10_43_6 TaxID=1974650 RepID=A0A2M6W277_9BACT|nr:MAG: phosphoribosyltransferase [Candidatus Magasanikbacteria bacterium CG10_big_fil_rev_8_21_14_0_10_43_6]